MELDSHFIGMAIAYFSWMQLCDDGQQGDQSFGSHPPSAGDPQRDQGDGSEACAGLVLQLARETPIHFFCLSPPFPPLLSHPSSPYQSVPYPPLSLSLSLCFPALLPDLYLPYFSLLVPSSSLPPQLDHSIPELLAVVQHSNVPPGKKVKACKRIAEFAAGGQVVDYGELLGAEV
eukprot:757412-Hanusia_phi.AAC.6